MRQSGWSHSQQCQPCDRDHIEIATLDTLVHTAGLSAFSMLHASNMMEVPDVYM